jgi:hypothetical protein
MYMYGRYHVTIIMKEKRPPGPTKRKILGLQHTRYGSGISLVNERLTAVMYVASILSLNRNKSEVA